MSEDEFPPTLLLAMPQLADPNFVRAAVLLCKHGEDGSLGFVVNRPIDTVASKLIPLDPPVKSAGSLTVWEGGPVSRERGWLLCRAPLDGIEGVAICEGLYMSSSQDALRRLLEGHTREVEANRSRLLLGYAGWAPGQLDSELAASSWLMIPLDVEMVFETPPEQLWEHAIRSLGVDPAFIAPAPGIH